MADESRVWVVEFADRRTYQLQWRDPVTQKLRTKTTDVPRTGLAKDRKAAERLAGEMESRLAAGSAAMPSRFTWEEFKARYRREVVPGLARESSNKIEVVLNLVDDKLSPRLLRDLNESRVSHLAATLRDGGRAETTIKSYLAHLKAMLRWAAKQKLIRECPAFPTIQRAKSSDKGTPMKGRAITTEEFERMLAKVPSVVGDANAAGWRHFLRGLWTSGLRLTESLDFSWDGDVGLVPAFPRRGRPMLMIPAESEKGHADRMLPMAPEFALFLLETPEADRTGYVFNLPGLRAKTAEVRSKWVGKIVSRIGEKAGVRVRTDPKTKKVKYASCHDFRRAFGERWAARLMPVQLMTLMRHESIETTLRFYVGHNAEQTASICWEAFEKTAQPVAVPVVEE